MEIFVVKWEGDIVSYHATKELAEERKKSYEFSDIEIEGFCDYLYTIDSIEVEEEEKWKSVQTQK